jgi:hypothetical protein
MKKTNPVVLCHKTAGAMAVTAGLDSITVNTILQQTLPSRFLLTVLKVEGDAAVIQVNGKALEVQSEIPLHPGQTLFVSQEQGAGGEIRLRLIRDVSAMETAGEQAVPQAGKEMDLLTALRLAELPVTAENTNKIAALLKTLGGLSLPNLLAAAAFLETGLSSSQMLEAVASFLNSLLSQQQEETQNETVDRNDVGQALKQAVLTRMQGLAEALRLPGQPEGRQNLDAALGALVAKSGESGRQALGGQVYTWTQTDQDGHNYLYLPLHTILSDYGLRNCELHVYPPPGEPKNEDDQGSWTFTLTLETEALGWMQFKLACQNRQVAVQALVEQPGTKLALEDNWPLLATGLDSLNLKLASQRCDLGRVDSQARSVQNLGMQFQQYNPFDVSV